MRVLPRPPSPPRLRTDLPLETADVETASDDYAGRFSGPVGAWFLRRQAETTLALLRPYPGAHILDIGGGHAQVAPALLAAGYRLTVAGSSPAAATRLAPEIRAGRVAFVSGDLLDLPFPDRAFDVTLSYRLLPHVTRPAALLAELARLADQALIFDYPEQRSLNAIAPLLFPWKRRLEGNTRPFTLFDGRELAVILRRHGFRQAARRPQFFWPMVLHRKLGSAALGRILEAPASLLGLTRAWGSPVIVKFTRATPAGGSAV